MVVLVVMGVCGCGKTTIGQALAKRIGCAFADADDLHPKSNVDKMRNGIPLTDEDRLPWLKSLHTLIKDWEVKADSWREVSQCDTAGETSVVKNQRTGKEERHSRANGSQVCDEVATGKSCTATPNQVMSGVLACSALRQSYRDILISGGQNCDGFKVSCVFVVLCGKEDTILARLKNRQGHYMPPSLLRSQLDALEVPTEFEGNGHILIQDLSKSVDDIVSIVLQQLSLLLGYNN